MINVDFAHIRRLIRMGACNDVNGARAWENKTRKAWNRRCTIPVGDCILESAAGVIANFTGGDDLTLFEVQDALNYLQELTTGQTEIVMGVINDQRLQDGFRLRLLSPVLAQPPWNRQCPMCPVPREWRNIYQSGGAPQFTSRSTPQTYAPTATGKRGHLHQSRLASILSRRARFAG